jgi:uncharacterized protein (TIGR03437 family)
VVVGAQELPTILLVDTENWVNYGNPVVDPSQLARNPGIVTTTPSLNFGTSVVLADVTAINGSAAKGVYVSEFQQLRFTPTPNPGQAISDVTRNGVVRNTIEILHPDGRLIGAIFATGLVGGTPAPGSPLGSNTDSITITGGTGAFLGAKGTFNNVQPGGRVTSQVEDPSMRRVHGGGRQRYVIQLIPMFRPEVLIGPSGPAVFHGDDWSPVTADRPARPGETLILYAKGLGPTNPSVNPGDPFPNEHPFALVTSPVEVFVNGRATPALNQLGVPRTTDTYRVDFRVPENTEAGQATVQLSAAWVKGAAVRIPVR